MSLALFNRGTASSLGSGAAVLFAADAPREYDPRRRGPWSGRVDTQECDQPLPDSLLQRVGKGDAAAVRECLDRFGGLVWTLARRFMYTNVEAEDAVQEIFVEVWRNASRYDPAIASESAFVAMIARRRLIDRRRKAERRPAGQSLPDAIAASDDGVHERSEDREGAGRAIDALQTLSVEQQRVLRLSIMHGLSHEKIATATGLPMGTVKTHARRGLMRLREILGGLRGGTNDEHRGAAAASAEGTP